MRLPHSRSVYRLWAEVWRGHHRSGVGVLRGVILVKLRGGAAIIRGCCQGLGCVAEAGAHESWTDGSAVIFACIRALLPLETASSLANLVGFSCRRL